ncbi:fibronectin type III domain-containing protein, partial [bacterium]|nr:fibronectin type III domain-containing protein [bacterium]
MNGLLRFFQMLFSIFNANNHPQTFIISRMKLARVFIRITMTAAVMGLTAPGNVSAQWSTSPTVNNAVSATTGDQKLPQAVSDGSGGTIIVWEDGRSGQSDIYAQRLNSSGVPQWTANGIVICNAGNVQSDAKIVSDGAGGAIITWMDMRGGTQDIYAQRVTPGGTTMWTANGIVICSASSNQNIPMITDDGSGGAIVAWNDTRDFVSVDIYAQRINSSGVAQWTADGVAICTATNTQSIGGITTDGAAGAIITWQDLRDGVDNKIYAQRISSAGVTQWTADGEAVSTFASYQDGPTITSDSSGGAFIAWRDIRNGDFDLYAQRIDGSGSLLWGGNAVAVAVADGFQQAQSIIGDGSGGLFLTWYDTRSSGNAIYAQRLNSSGSALWAANGVAAAVSGFNNDPVITSDGAGGIFISWWNVPGADADIYAQRIDGSGNVLWSPNGNVVCSATGQQFWHTLTHDGSGNAIAIWSDQRNGNWDIYAQLITAAGNLGNDLPPSAPSGLYAIAQNGQVELNWSPTGNTSKYYIYYDITANPTTLQDSATGGSSNTSITINGLTNGTLYYFRVRSANIGGLSGYSNEDPAVPAVKAGNALAFDGSSDYAYSNIATTATDNVTLEAWVKWDGVQDGVDKLFLYNGNTGSNGFGLFIDWQNGYRISGTVDRVVTMQSSVLMPINVWTHVALVRNFGTWSLFVDGQSFALTNNTFAPNTPSGSTYIGADNGSDPFGGQLDEIRIWNVARSQSEIQNAIGVPLRGDEPGIAALWHLDEPFGTTTIYDASPNGEDAFPIFSSNFVPSGAMQLYSGPNLISASPGDGDATLRWYQHGKPDVITYRIFADTSPGATTQVDSTTTISDTTKTITGLTNAQTYYVRVAAVDISGNQSIYSNELSVTPQPRADAFGYTWKSSDEGGGPVFNWVDITGVGTPISGTGDDNSFGPFPIGFGFPYYNNNFSTFRIATNGFISFTSSDAPYSTTLLP